MATPYNGRYCSVSLGSTIPVELQGHWEINLALDELDASEFGTVWKKSMNGMQGWTGSISGFLFASSTAGSTGQYSLQMAALNQTKLQDIRFWVDSTKSGATTDNVMFWMPNFSTGGTNYSTDAGCYIGTINMAGDKNALATVSYSVRGYGPIALYKGSSTGPTVVY